MGTTCSWIRVWRHLRATGHRADGAGPSASHATAQPDPDTVIRQVTRGVPMTVPELHRAAAVLDRLVGSGRMDVFAARLRIAIRLEGLDD